MTEYPLLCKPEVVRAILDGRQTQDRRPITERYCFSDAGLKRGINEICLDKAWAVTDKSYLRVPYRHVDDVDMPWEDCGSVRVNPKYKPGDVLWVRETFAIKSKSKPLALQRRPIECYMEYVHGADQLKEGYELVYRADSDYPVKWRPSIHMLREFCRLRLRVKRVWVERVQDKNDWVWCCEFEKEEKQTCGNCQKKCKADPNAYNACPDWKPKTTSAGL